MPAAQRSHGMTSQQILDLNSLRLAMECQICRHLTRSSISAVYSLMVLVSLSSYALIDGSITLGCRCSVQRLASHRNMPAHKEWWIWSSIPYVRGRIVVSLNQSLKEGWFQCSYYNSIYRQKRTEGNLLRACSVQGVLTGIVCVCGGVKSPTSQTPLQSSLNPLGWDWTEQGLKEKVVLSSHRVPSLIHWIPLLLANGLSSSWGRGGRIHPLGPLVLGVCPICATGPSCTDAQVTPGDGPTCQGCWEVWWHMRKYICFLLSGSCG